MNTRKWEIISSWLREHLGQILGGVFVGGSTEFALRTIHPPVSSADEAIFAGTATVLAFYAGIVLDYLIDVKRLSLKPPLKVYRNQSSADLDSLSFIVQERPRKAKLLEYSSATVHGIVNNLVAANTDIQLLLQHPSYAVTDEQRRRICAQVESYSMESGEYQHLRIRCYRGRASVRGRKFDDKLIHLGWYRYEASQAQNQEWVESVWGHNNPLISPTGEAKEIFNLLSEWFDRTFDEYWNRGARLTTVCDECPDLHALNIAEDWLKLVSSE